MAKKTIEAAKKVDRTKQYELADAVKLLKEVSFAKFNETVELHVRLGIDSRQSDQQVRGAVVLPFGTGKTKRVAVFAKGEKAKEAELAGADIIGAEDLAARIQQENFLDFDIVVATPDMMGALGRLGKILGPKGLMPNPKTGTVTFEIERAIKEIKAGKVEYRVDKTNIVHVPVGKVSFEENKLAVNISTLMEALVKAKPAAAKGTYLKSVVIASTMGPGIKLNPQTATIAISEK